MPGKRPYLVMESLWQTPQAWTRMRTWPGPGSGNSFWTSWNAPPAAGTWTARPVTVSIGAVFSCRLDEESNAGMHEEVGNFSTLRDLDLVVGDGAARFRPAEAMFASPLRGEGL